MQEIFRKLKSSIRNCRSVELIRASTLFDESFYLHSHPHVAVIGCDPVQYYLDNWLAEDLDPHPLFDSSFYVEQDNAIRASGLSPLVHYITCGAAGRLDPHPLFDTDFYMQGNACASIGSMNPLQHYLCLGANEGLNPHPCFDTAFYLECNPDVIVAAINPLAHFVCFGAREGRSPHPLFDTTYYLSQHPQLDAGCDNPLLHYLKNGASELLSPSPLFDARYYLGEDSEVAASGVNPLLHYLLVGEKERRRRLPDRPSRIESIAPAVAASAHSDLSPVSLVITTQNRTRLLSSTIEQCVSHAGGVELEFIVVDTGAKDNTIEDLASLAGRYRNLRWHNLPNGRPGQARNLGAASALHPIVLFITDDVQPVDFDFFRMHSLLHGVHWDKNIAVLGSVEHTNFADVRQASRQSDLLRESGFLADIPHSIHSKRNGCQSALSVKKALVEDWSTDGFNCDFSISAVEAVEFLLRQCKRSDKFRIYSEPSAAIACNQVPSAQTLITRAIQAGMMYKSLVDLHPEASDFLNLSKIVQALQTARAAENDLLVADYLAMVEGAKARARMREKTGEPNSKVWRAQSLDALLELCLRQGFVMAWREPGANFEAAYKLMIDDFQDDARQSLDIPANTSESQSIGQQKPLCSLS